MTRRKKWGIALTVPFGCALLAVLGAFHDMSQKDVRHARFYNTGKTINSFLQGYCGDLEHALADHDAGVLAERYSNAYGSPGRGVWTWGRDVEDGGVVMRTLRAEGSRDYGREALAAELDAYLQDFARIDQAICKIDLIEEVDLGRRVTLTVKVIVDGVGQDDEHFQDRMFYRWHLSNEAGAEEAYTWRIERDELVEGIRVSGDAQGFYAAAPAALGIDFEHRRDPKLHMKKFRDELAFGVIQHASGGLSAADYNGDGRPDLFFLSGTDCRLYRNDGASHDAHPGQPAFTDVTDEVGLAGIDQAHVALFADFDNDGDRDLFVGRYLAPNLFYRNDGVGALGRVTFTETSAEAGVDFVAPVTAATLLDYDKDGDLDLYLSINGNAFEAFPRLPFYAQNGRPNRLLRNEWHSGSAEQRSAEHGAAKHGAGVRFTDVTEESGTGDVGWSLAVASADYDADGYPDIAVANDFGRKNLYRNNGDGTFQEVAKDARVLDFSGGMGLTFGDFDDDGRVDLYTSNINSNQRWFGEDMTVTQYTRNVLRSQWFFRDFPEYVSLYSLVGSDWPKLGQQIGEGNSLFRNSGDGTFEERKDSHTERAGWGWGVAFFDYDNDTDLDIYAANGWISNAPGTDL